MTQDPKRFQRSVCAAAIAVTALGAAFTSAGGCGGKTELDQSGQGGAGSHAGGASGVGASSTVNLSGASSSNASTASGGATACSNTGTVSGVVFDPAGANPVFDVSVFVPVPGVPLPDLSAIPLECGCNFYPELVQASTSTDVLGHYQLTNVPAGPFSLVVQSDRWRRRYDGLTVDACASNVFDLRLPANAAEGDLPQIAIATGGGDSLECLPLRVGVSASEYGPAGHVHLFAGQNGATASGPTPSPAASLWSSATQLSGYHVVMLSCEGAPTANVTDQNRQALVDYAGMGGRVYASHLQSAWFASGPLAGQIADFADAGEGTLGDAGPLPAVVVTTLTSGYAFSDGVALGSWLTSTQGSGQATFPVWFAHGQVVQALSPLSTLWVNLASTSPQAPGTPEVLSVDLPLGASAEGVCGRITFADYHVTGGPAGVPAAVGGDYDSLDGGSRIAPDGCAVRALSPQERVLEFSLLRQTTCIHSVGQTSPPGPPPPK